MDFDKTGSVYSVNFDSLGAHPIVTYSLAVLSAYKREGRRKVLIYVSKRDAYHV